MSKKEMDELRKLADEVLVYETDEERLAEEHAEWFSKACKFVYKEAWLHGFKHGKEAGK